MAALLGAGIGVASAHAVAALSIYARARTVMGRVRLRLVLLAVSAAAGGLHHLLAGQPRTAQAHFAGVLQSMVELLATAGIVICLGLGVAGLVVAAADGCTTLIWLRRLLDGSMTAASLLTLSWVLLLHRVDKGGDVSYSLLALARVTTDVLILGLLVALRFSRRSGERTAVTVAAVALSVLAMSDVLRILLPAPGVWSGIPLAAVCSMAGSFLVALVPWLPGGASIMGADRREMPVAGVVVAFVPVVVCVLAMAAHVLAGGHPDVVMLALTGSVLLGLSARQGVAHADHLQLTREAAAREAHYRKLVDGSSDVITIVGLDGRVLYISPAVHEVFGYRPEELVGARLPLYTHPDDVAPLMQAVETLRQEAESGTCGPGRCLAFRIRAMDGQWRHVESTVSHHTDGLIFNSRDVTERVTLQAQLQHLAFHDALTGLPNRALFIDRVKHALQKRTADATPPAVIFLDLDGFKAVNDSAGHAAGDDLLVQAARRLQASVRAADTVARLGGDEFAALLEGDAGACPSRTREVAERILSALMKPYRIGGTHAVVAASIGIAVATPGITPGELLHNADLVMYEAKAAGKGRIRMHGAQPQSISCETSSPAIESRADKDASVTAANT
ncbi:sensor domain-containing diguanylate cyclase [Streptomyces peucetius]|uniref:Sensor domain-containing diguanylate cyclase n=1 Tax=Streptomyces peucetius TaxID=1950 RepID=A0ABY6IIR7_STRPE|nr:sensor domain-containing diguanylate cyclase [Streptomyces peucetius]UYQ65717.1 sensor domain-containing diguanylate cyclase [Streptomyces peucetius]